MKSLIFITGGVRSGKSKFGQELAKKLSPNPIYLATAKKWDKDFEQRIIQHQMHRDGSWTTIEEETEIGKIGKLNNNGVVLLDCITLWITNIYNTCNYKMDLAISNSKKEWDNFFQSDCTCIAISNEIGMGLHGETNSVRKFVDLQGIMNQYIASMADEVYFMVSGIPLKIK